LKTFPCGKNQHNSAHPRNEDKVKHKIDEKSEKNETIKTVKRYHNCGLSTHFAIVQ